MDVYAKFEDIPSRQISDIAFMRMRRTKSLPLAKTVAGKVHRDFKVSKNTSLTTEPSAYVHTQIQSTMGI